MVKRLIGPLDARNPQSISDVFSAFAYSIEESLLIAGAVPGKDYSYKDLYQLAQPFVLEQFCSSESKAGWLDFPPRP